MLRQEIAWFDQKVNSTGALATRLASDASAVKGVSQKNYVYIHILYAICLYVSSQITGIRFGSILQIFGGLVTAIAIGFSASWELTLVLMFAFPVLFLAGYFQIHLLSGRAEENKQSIEESGQIAAESIDNIDTVVSLGIEPQFCSRYENLLHGPFR